MLWEFGTCYSFLCAQGCDQVARDSPVAGRRLCPFLVTSPVRTLNSNPAPMPTHAYLGRASHCRHKPESIQMPGRAPQCRPRETQQVAGGSLWPVHVPLYVGHPHAFHGAFPGPLPQPDSASCFPTLFCLCLKVVTTRVMLMCRLIALPHGVTSS